MFSAINAAFPPTETNNCLQTITDSEFHIYDHETGRRCYLQHDPDGVKHFTVKNTVGYPVHFLAIDKCLLTDSELTQRCDCAVFDEQMFCFIEIKTTSSDNDRRIAKCRKKATDQLQATISYFRDKIGFETVQVEAYITLVTESSLEGDQIPEPRSKPRVRANLTAKITEFDEMGVSLFYSNEKHFT